MNQFNDAELQELNNSGRCSDGDQEEEHFGEIFGSIVHSDAEKDDDSVEEEMNDFLSMFDLHEKPLFNSTAVFLRDKCSFKFCKNNTKKNIFLSCIFSLYLLSLFLLLYFGSFAGRAKFNVNPVNFNVFNQSLTSPVLPPTMSDWKHPHYFPCTYFWNLGHGWSSDLDVQEDVYLARCQADCGFFIKRGTFGLGDHQVEVTIKDPTHNDEDFNVTYRQGYLCSAAFRSNIINPWNTMFVVKKISRYDFIIEKPAQVKYGHSIGYSISFVILFFHLFLFLLLSSPFCTAIPKVSIQEVKRLVLTPNPLEVSNTSRVSTHSSRPRFNSWNFIWFMSLLSSCYWYVGIVGQPHYDYQKTMDRLTGYFLLFLAVAFVFYYYCAKYTAYPLADVDYITLLNQEMEVTSVSHTNVLNSVTVDDHEDDRDDNMTSDCSLLNVKQTNAIGRDSLLQVHYCYFFDVLMFFLLPLCVFIHWNFLDYIVLPELSLATNDGRERTVGTWIELGLLISLVLAVAGWSVYNAYKYHRLKYMGIFYLLLISTIGVSTFFLVKKPFNLPLHLHHYLLGFFLLPLTLFKNKISIFFQALCLGLFISGSAGWGLMGLWSID